MSYFFNGRLWVSPAVMSVVDDSAMLDENLATGNVVAMIGQSTGGAPNTVLTFGNPSDALATLRSGDLCDAVVKAFNPSDETAGPSSVVAIRVNPATQSVLALKDAAAATVINLASADYGIWTANIAAKVQAGSVNGLALTVQNGNQYFTQDNVYNAAFSVHYTGAQTTATVVVTATQLILNAPSGTPLATVTLANYETLADLVAFINTVTGFTASVLGPNSSMVPNGNLDGVTAQDVKTTTYNVTATLKAAVDWFNSPAAGGLVVATRGANALTLPAPIPTTALTGGADGSTTNTSWSNAFTTLQGADVQWVCPLSPTPAIWAMADAHCQYMSTVGRMERRAFVGEALATADATAITDALNLNSDRTALVHVGYYDYDQNGNLLLQPPYKLAAIIAAAFSGVSPGVAMTNKALTLRGMERNLRDPTDTDALILGGVMPVAKTKTGYRVVRSVSTWLNNTKYDKVEISVGAALDYTSRSVRDAVSVLKGAQGTPANISLAATIVETTLLNLAQPAPVGPGILVGDAANPPFKNIKVSLSGDVLAIQFQCSPVIPINYIPVTIFAVPFSGSLSVAVQAPGSASVVS